MSEIEYKVGMWLKEKHTGNLFEITEVLLNTHHTGPNRCVFVRRLVDFGFCQVRPFNEAVNVIRSHYDIVPLAQVLYK